VTLGSIFQLFGALALTLGLLAVALAVLRRLPAVTGRHSAGLELVQRLPLGPRQGVAVVRVAGRMIVVGVAEHGLSLLGEMTAEDWAPYAKTSPRVEDASAPKWALRIPGFGRIALALLLTLGLGGFARAARAQAAAAPTTTTTVTTRTPATTTTTTATTRTPAGKTPAAVPHVAPIVPRAIPGFSVNGPAPPQIDLKIGDGAQALHLNGAVGLVVFLGALTLLPAMFLLMTSFTRILIVLSFLRSALGTQTTPPTQLLVAFAVLLTGVVMNPVLQETQKTALQPYLDGKLTQVQAYSEGIKPFREFMLTHTRAQDLQTFAELSGATAPADSVEALPTVTVVSAFVTSELRTAFQMGFLIFLPFVVVDVIVASVLMSLGMFMLPPVMISLPFKLLLFVLADGWTLVVQNLVASFR